MSTLQAIDADLVRDTLFWAGIALAVFNTALVIWAVYRYAEDPRALREWRERTWTTLGQIWAEAKLNWRHRYRRLHAHTLAEDWPDDRVKAALAIHERIRTRDAAYQEMLADPGAVAARARMEEREREYSLERTRHRLVQWRSSGRK